MSGKVINIHDAKIKTVSVGIRALTISDKQVTLAVFRQLYEEALISEAGTLNGLPWGIVNYHPDGCKDYPAHRHIVWQKGDELRRASVRNEPKFEVYQSDTAKRYMETKIIAIAQGLCSEAMPEIPYDGAIHMSRQIAIRGFIADDIAKLRRIYRGVEHGTPDVDMAWIDAESESHDARVELWKNDMKAKVGHDLKYFIPERLKCKEYGYPAEPQKHPFANYALEVMNEAMNKAIKCRTETKINDTLTILSAKLNNEIADEIARRDRWIKTTKELQSLPQLFVAV